MFDIPRRGRGRGRGTYTPSQYIRPQTPSPTPVPSDLGEILDTLRSDAIDRTESNYTTIRNAQGVASYNWLGSVNRPTIAIPGAPPKWTPPMIHPQLSEDAGTYYRDLNAAHCPQHPLHPIALAVLSNPSISTADVDLMACSSTLRSLFMFTRGERKTFRIMVEEVGNTVFFIRREGSPRETISNVKGYGHTMPEAYTTWHRDVRGSVSSQRVVQYNFAGLNCLVRYEPDGYLSDKLPVGAAASSARDSAGSAQPGHSLDDLSAAMIGTNVTTSLPPASSTGDLIVRRAGTNIPQSATFELKTRSVHRKDEDFFREFASRLWLTQTPYFLLAFHRRGRFEEIRVRDVRDEIARWEFENAEDIKKFAGLIEWVMKRVRTEPDGLMELWRHESGDLEVRSPGAEFFGALPSDVEDRWTGEEDSGVLVAGDESDG